MGRGVQSPGAALALLLRLLLVLPGAAVADDSLRFDFGKGGNAAGQPAYEAARGFGFEASDGTRELFSVRVPEGNYRVTLSLGDHFSLAGFRLLAEQRRLMASFGDIGGQPPDRISVIVNVRTPDLPALPENATGGTRVSLKPREIGGASWDDKLTLEFAPKASMVKQVIVERVSLPTLYLAGDSTVTDQPTAPSGSWGQFLTPRVRRHHRRRQSRGVR